MLSVLDVKWENIQSNSLFRLFMFILQYCEKYETECEIEKIYIDICQGSLWLYDINL